MVQPIVFSYEREEYIDSIAIARQIANYEIFGVDRLVNVNGLDLLVTCDEFDMKPDKRIYFEKGESISDFIENLEVAIGDID
jgi:hypothetical protein